MGKECEGVDRQEIEEGQQGLPDRLLESVPEAFALAALSLRPFAHTALNYSRHNASAGEDTLSRTKSIYFIDIINRFCDPARACSIVSILTILSTPAIR
jgi:hypothetical protein